MASRLITVCFLSVALLFVSKGYSLNITVPVDSAKGPMCIVVDSINKVAVPLSPCHSVYNTVITDGLAQLTLTQMFVNDYGTINDIVYVFPLPHQAAVHAMSMEYRGKFYKAEIFEKKEAQAKYDSVIQSGGNAALLLQDRPNVFQQRLANIAFKDTAWIQITLSMPLSYDNGRYELAIPTMVAERFQSSGASTVMSSGRGWNPPADRDGATIEINVLLQTGFPVTGLTSPTHSIDTASIDAIRDDLVKRNVIEKNTEIEMAHAYGVCLKKVATYPNKDFVLRFNRTAAEMDFTVASFYDTTLKTGYFYSNLFPDTALFSGDRSKLDIVILVDVSGSQSGWPLAKEKEIATAVMAKLTPNDRFTVLAFSDNVTWCFGQSTSVPATGENVATAQKFVNGLTTIGGTNLLGGVQSALGITSGEGFSRFFIFLTDGLITNEDAILSAIRQHPTAPSVLTFGAGGSLNRYFLDEAAKVGNGISTEITSSEDVVPVVNTVWDKIESPQLKDIKISCSGLDQDQLLLPNGSMLYKGAPVTMYGVYDRGGSRTITVTGTRNGETVTLEKEITLADAPNANTMIPRIWAKQMISRLRLDEGTGTANKNHIIELSKEYQVLSDYTAFLAINPVEVTNENSISGRPTALQYGAAVVSVPAVSIQILPEMLIIEIPDGSTLQEITLYDMRGRCLLKVPVSFGQKSFRLIWDRLLPHGKKLARGHFILKIRTTHGLITRSVFLR